jgi:hypothetical protein
MSQSPGFFLEEPERQLSEETCSVTCSAVSIDGSAVGQIAKSLERASDDVVGGAPVNIGDKSHSARIVLVVRVVQQFVAAFVWHSSPARLHASNWATIERRMASRPDSKKLLEQ